MLRQCYSRVLMMTTLLTRIFIVVTPHPSAAATTADTTTLLLRRLRRRRIPLLLLPHSTVIVIATVQSNAAPGSDQTKPDKNGSCPSYVQGRVPSNFLVVLTRHLGGCLKSPHECCIRVLSGPTFVSDVTREAVLHLG